MADIVFEDVLPDFFTAVDHRKSAVWGQRLILPSAKCLAISAASGKGKSTFLNYIFGIRQLPNGKVIFNEKNVLNMTSEERSIMRSRHMSMVFQDLLLFGHLSARDNILLKQKQTKEIAWDRIEQWADHLEVRHLLERPCDRLSLGQQQRVALLRALAQPFEWLLLDEPTSHLDQANAQRVMNLVLAECAQRKAGCLVSTLDHQPFFETDQILYC